MYNNQISYILLLKETYRNVNCSYSEWARWGYGLWLGQLKIISHLNQ